MLSGAKNKKNERFARILCSFAAEMTRETLELLQTPEARHWIEAMLDTEPAAAAVALTRQGVAAPLRLAVADQVKYLQRARVKLPSYFEARCVVPQLAYEQASSEATAAFRAARYGQTQGRLLDLTCGQGADSLHFARVGMAVATLETDPLRADIARHNFAQLGQPKIAVHSTSAEEFLQTFAGQPFDLIYADPARRDAGGGRLFLPAECSPNVLEMMPLLRKWGKKILLKLSPLYDVRQAWRDFPEATEVAVVSVGGECREVLIWFGGEAETPRHTALICRSDDPASPRQTWEFPTNAPSPTPQSIDFQAKYLLEPDVAFYKMGLLPQLLAQFNFARALHPDGFAVSPEMVNNWPGRVFQILEEMPFKPKEIKRRLDTLGWKRVNIVRRNFPLTVAEIRTQLRVAEGGNEFLLCTIAQNGQKMAYFARRQSPV